MCCYAHALLQKNVTEVYAKIHEVTGIHDRGQIDRAISACRDKTGKYAMDDVINMLLENSTPAVVQSGPVRISIEIGNFCSV